MKFLSKLIFIHAIIFQLSIADGHAIHRSIVQIECFFLNPSGGTRRIEARAVLINNYLNEPTLNFLTSGIVAAEIPENTLVVFTSFACDYVFMEIPEITIGDEGIAMLTIHPDEAFIACFAGWDIYEEEERDDYIPNQPYFFKKTVNGSHKHYLKKVHHETIITEDSKVYDCWTGSYEEQNSNVLSTENIGTPLFENGKVVGILIGFNNESKNNAFISDDYLNVCSFIQSQNVPYASFAKLWANDQSDFLDYITYVDGCTSKSYKVLDSFDPILPGKEECFFYQALSYETLIIGPKTVKIRDTFDLKLKKRKSGILQDVITPYEGSLSVDSDECPNVNGTCIKIYLYDENYEQTDGIIGGGYLEWRNLDDYYMHEWDKIRSNTDIIGVINQYVSGEQSGIPFQYRSGDIKNIGLQAYIGHTRSNGFSSLKRLSFNSYIDEDPGEFKALIEINITGVDFLAAKVPGIFGYNALYSKAPIAFLNCASNDTGGRISELIDQKSDDVNDGKDGVSTIYPNSFSDIMNLVIDSELEQTMDLYLLDLNGQKVFRKEVNLKKGSQHIYIEDPRLTGLSGLYTLRLEYNNDAFNYKVLARN